MSYAQAMKWAKKHPKGIKQMYFGFAPSETPWPSPYNDPECAALRDISEWFHDRHFYGIKRARDVIKERIAELRLIRAESKAVDPNSKEGNGNVFDK